MPENVRWRRGGVSFAALQVVGGNNGLATWTGNSGPTPEQTAEVLARTAGVVEEIRDVFAGARGAGDRAVVLFMQADLFAPGAAYEGSYAYQPIVQALAREAREFGGPVYLFNGDTHRYAQDRPLQHDSPWLDFYGTGRRAEPHAGHDRRRGERDRLPAGERRPGRRGPHVAGRSVRRLAAAPAGPAAIAQVAKSG